MQKAKVKSEVFNSGIGAPYGAIFPQTTRNERRLILAELFEQLLVFDRVIISTNRLNVALTLLIDEIGLELTERLIERGYVKIMMWSPIIVTSVGKQAEDGTTDESVIYGKPPIAAGTYTGDDLDPEKSVYRALDNFNFSRNDRREFTRKAVKAYITFNGMSLAQQAEDVIMNAYSSNILADLGLPAIKEPTELDVSERTQLMHLGHKILETKVLSKFNLKSYENYDHYKICERSIENIGKAFNISQNTTEILRIENTPNLKELFISEKLKFEDVFSIRNFENAKYYRKWINSVGENSNSQEVTSEYLKEIKGKTKFFETKQGRFMKNLGLFGITGGLGEFLGGHVGAAIGTVAGAPIVDYGLGLLEEFWLSDLLKGKNPSMFIDDIKNSISK